MKILNEYFKDCKVVIMDIETTGLVSEKDHVIVGGLLGFKDDKAETIQFFADTPSAEKQLLEDFMPFLRAADVIISYNGDSFDLPFLNKRLQKNGMDDFIPGYKSFDLYRILRKSSFSRILPNLKQKTVEQYMGISFERADEISGRECVEYYLKYQETGDAALKAAILLHNGDDLVQLRSLMDLLKNLDLHAAMYRIGFNIIEAGRKITVSKIHFGPGSVIVKGFHSGIPMDYVAFAPPYKIKLTSTDQAFIMEIPFEKHDGHAYIDLNEFGFDHQDFHNYAGYQKGYLILKNGQKINYAEINHLIKRISREILSSF